MTYRFNTLKQILSVEVNKYTVWKQRMKLQTQYIHLLEEVFDTDIPEQTFGFYPNKAYFATSLTTDPEYTKTMKPTWTRIIKRLEKIGWEVYAPFQQTDPHAKNPDTLDSYQIRDLDHVQVLTSEVALMDLNRPSHGVGQEIEMSIFLPKIAFAKERVSRMTKGMPGLLLLKYEDEKQLLNLLSQVFARKNFKKEPFYLSGCPAHKMQAIFKGSACLNCVFAPFTHPA